MILFVFEGQKEEPHVMATIKHLFFSGREKQMFCSFGCDTYALWQEVRKYLTDGGEPDVFEIVRERLHTRDDHSLDGYYSYQFDSVYLFFDYDPQNGTICLGELNSAIEHMIHTFSDPMGNGLLLLSYPMTEALYCENCLPDSDYMNAVVPIADCHDFKTWCQRYDFAKKRYKLTFKTNKAGEISEQVTDIRQNELLASWNELIKLNASKANDLCCSSSGLPLNESDISQNRIFRRQLELFILPAGNVTILSAFPLFLFEYFHGNGSF